MPNIQFINLSHPSDATSAECQKTAHSHAARMAHARARRLRNLANQRDEKESRRSQAGENSDGKTERGSTAHNEEAVRQVWVRTILEPSPKSPLSANRADPFGSFAMALNRTEQYLLDHYVTVLAPFLTKNPWRSGRLDTTESLPKQWVRLGVADTSFLLSIFLCASRHLTETQVERREMFSRLAIAYKVATVQALLKSMSDGTKAPTDTTISMGLIMVLDELLLGDYPMSKQHVQGVKKMVEIRGGPQALGLNGMLEELFNKIGSEEKLLGILQNISDPCQRVAIHFEPCNP